MKKLLKIFNRKDFRVGDYIDHLVSKKIIDEHWHTRIIGIDILLKDVNEGSKLIQPTIILSDVLYRLTKKIGIMHFTINMINSNIMEFGDIMKYNPKTGKGKWIRWILANKDGLALDLWSQSDETKKFIAEILDEQNIQ